MPVLNSNSPEVVQQSGILLSTFPPAGKATPSAHLNFAFRDRFDIFAHHIAKPRDPQDLTTLYLGILAYNPSSEPGNGEFDPCRQLLESAGCALSSSAQSAGE